MGLFLAWYFSRLMYCIVLVWFSFLNSWVIKVSGITIPPAKELKNCLLFSCSTILASNWGAVIPLFKRNFSLLLYCSHHFTASSFHSTWLALDFWYSITIFQPSFLFTKSPGFTEHPFYTPGATTSVLAVVAIGHPNVGRGWVIKTVVAYIGDHSHSAVFHHHEVANF